MWITRAVFTVCTVAVSVASLALPMLHAGLTLLLPRGARNLKAKPCDHLKSEHFQESSGERIHETVDKYVPVAVSEGGSRRGTNNQSRGEKYRGSP